MYKKFLNKRVKEAFMRDPIYYHPVDDYYITRYIKVLDGAIKLNTDEWELINLIGGLISDEYKQEVIMDLKKNFNDIHEEILELEKACQINKNLKWPFESTLETELKNIIDDIKPDF